MRTAIENGDKETIVEMINTDLIDVNGNVHVSSI